jgi:O-antigen ligase
LGGAALYCWFIVTRFSVGSGGRLGNLVYYDANDLALWIVVTLPIAVYFLTKPGAKVWTRLLVAATAGLMMLALVKTGSRGGFLGLIAVGVYLLVGYRSIPVQKRLAAAGGLLLVMMAVAGEQYWDMMATLLNPTDDYNWDTSNPGGAGRRAVWNRGIGYMLDNPLTGVGAKAFAVAEGTIGPTAHLQAVGRGLKWSAAHNSFVQIGAELGVFGLVAFVAMLGTAYRSGRRVAARVGADPRVKGLGQAFSGSVIGFAVSGAFLSQAFGAYLYALMALVVALDRVSSTAASRSDLVEPAPTGPGWRHNVVAPRRSLREPVHVRRARRGGSSAAEAG